jgi:uncharacterized membrane protein YkvA (DUF1232 family)
VDLGGLVLGVAAALVVAWLVVLTILLALRPAGIDVAEAGRFLPDLVRLVRDLARDRSLGRGVRAPLLLLLAYLASPVDLVPDFLPVVGYADDVIVVVVVLRLVIRRAGPSIVQERWRGTPQGLALLSRLVQRPGG